MIKKLTDSEIISGITEKEPFFPKDYHKLKNGDPLCAIKKINRELFKANMRNEALIRENKKLKKKAAEYDALLKDYVELADVIKYKTYGEI